MGYEIYDSTVLNSEADCYGIFFSYLGFAESDSEVDEIFLTNQNILVYDIENGCLINW